jgi:methionyl-tRNA formyltransferase
MRLAFAGTPEFAVATLSALHAAGHQIAGVFTQPDRPAGRGRRLSPSPVAQRAQALGLPVHTPERFRDEAQAALRAMEVDALVVVAYGLILPVAALAIPPLGGLNIHASLLPRWRGAAPIQRAIEAGDTETGVTIMQMEAGLDTGPMWLRARCPIEETTTAAELHDRLRDLGATLIVEALDGIKTGRLAAEPQPTEGVSYAAKLSKEEARIDWQRPAAEIARRIRAFNPVPVAWTEAAGERLRLWQAVAEPGMAVPGDAGEVLTSDHDGLRVQCGEGVLRITAWQWPGGTVQTPGPGRLAAGSRLT